MKPSWNVFFKNQEQEILEWEETVLIELSLQSPYVSPPYLLCFRPLSPFSVVSANSLNLGLKCWNSAFNAQGSRVIIVIVHVGEVKIYVAAMLQALRKKETQDETQFTTKIGGKTSLGPSYFIL